WPARTVANCHCLPSPLNLEELYVTNTMFDIQYSICKYSYSFCQPNRIKVIDFTGTSIGGWGQLEGLKDIMYLSLQNTNTTILNIEAFNCKHWPKIQTLLLGNLDLRPT
ncbi:unnamed protein product, partial [Owenia fusiformis]